MRDLNPEIKIDLAAPGAPAREPTLILIGSARARDAAQTANAEARIGGLIAARLDNPGEIVIAPVRPPCLACAGETLAIFGTKSETAELVKMMAATEAIKYLVQPDATAATIIKFDRLASRTETLRERANCAVCTGSG